MKNAVSRKGQITIPKPVRDRLGIVAGTVLTFRARGDELVARKAVSPDPVRELFGILHSRQSSDELVRALRGDDP